MKTVLVTGAGGFLGGALLRHLLAARAGCVVGSVRRAARAPAPLFRGDLARRAEAERLLRRVKPSVVFHCAGSVTGGPDELFGSNVLSTIYLLEAALGLRRRPRVVLVGSAAEYGAVPRRRQPLREDEPCRPLTPYGRSKFCQSLLVPLYARRGLSVTAGRLFNLLGPGLPRGLAPRDFAELVRRARRRPGFVGTVGRMSGVRDFVSLRDACGALAALARRGRAGEIYNVCSGRAVVMRDVLRETLRLSDTPLAVREEGPNRGVPYAVGDPAKIRRDAGWKARDGWRDALKGLLSHEGLLS